RRALHSAGVTESALKYYRTPDWAGVEEDLLWLEQPGNSLVTIRDERYPGLLSQIPDPPIALCVRGEPAVLKSVQMAIVGSRNPTPGGRRTAHRFAHSLAVQGLTITSGLAIGIDSCAHEGALDAKGLTAAVLGNGPDSVYPRQNQRLADRVAESGAVVSEFPTGYRALAANFPRRNRIISGLSVGTLVVEAAKRSGSLITARHALEQGREVFAVPGSIQNPMVRGCHELIRQGAGLVECNEDILEEIGHLVAVVSGDSRESEAAGAEDEGLDGTSRLLLDNIGYEPVHVDSLIESANLPAGVTVSALSSLEIAGLIESLPGGSYIRR
ncbi:MAG: DNA-processing protein DprA, partial [Gammaproteobacteria bacterium]